ncbi:MAG: response regulator, partial [Kiritimatiellae bacterium]|nr:response regulator [Kiritimatiellia bacterium]
MNSVLIVDDNREMRDLLAAILDQGGYTTGMAADGETALKKIAKKYPDVILLDLRLPGMDGLALLEQIKIKSPASNVVMITGHGGVKDAVNAMQLGAFDFIGKPFDNDELLLIIKRACENINLRRELENTKAQLEAQKESVKVQGDSPAIRTVLKLVRIVAPTSMTVILQGESGVGKEVIANLIHRHSQRHDKPFIPVDCGTIPE